MLQLSRWCARAALLGGALFVVEGLLILANPEYYDFDSPLGLLVLVVEGAALLAALKEGAFLAGGMTYVLGVVVISAGYLLLGVATARAGTLPVWSGPALTSGLAGLWGGNAVGSILCGLAWVFVGIALRPGKGAQTGSYGDAG